MLQQAERLDYRERESMPSKGQIQNVQNLLSCCANKIVPCSVEETSTRECVSFDVK